MKEVGLPVSGNKDLRMMKGKE